MKLSFVTLGDPKRLTGGYLYHQRMAAAAPEHDAEIRFVSFPDRPLPLPTLAGRRLVADAARGAAGVLVDSIAAAFAAPWLGRVDTPVVGVLHQPPGGIDHGAVRRLVQARLDLVAHRRSDLLIVASGALADDVLRAGLPRDRIVVVPPGRDVATGTGPPPDLRAGRRAAILCVGNWLPRKGILEVLDALAGLPADAATLHLVGAQDVDRRYERAVRRRLAASDIRDRVVVHGPVDRTVVAAMYAAADIFALASEREPYGTVYGEAMAAGLPIVAWRAGNALHLARDGREGLLVEPGDVAALTSALARLIDDEGARRAMGEAAARRAQSFPTWDESATSFFNAIDRAIAARVA